VVSSTPRPQFTPGKDPVPILQEAGWAPGHLTSCTPTKSSLYLANSLVTVISEPDAYRLHTVHVPSIISLFNCLVLTKGSINVLSTCTHFVASPVFTVRNF